MAGSPLIEGSKASNSARHCFFAAIKHYWVAAESVGGVAIIVDAKDNGAAKFYQHFGFEPFVSDALKLFMPLGTVRHLFAS